MLCITKRLFCASLSLCIGNFLVAQEEQAPEISSSNFVETLVQPSFIEAALPTDEASLDLIYQEVCKENPYAEKLWGDVLMRSAAESKEKKEARSLYKAAAKQGVPSAELSYAKALQATEQNKDEKVYEHLEEASALGNSEADRLLTELLLKTPTAENKQKAWELLNRAADRKELKATLEVAQAYLSGTWQNMELKVDQAKAQHYYEIALEQQAPEAALQLSLLLSQNGSETTQEDYRESVDDLYYAYLWAHDNGDTELIEQINQLGDTNAIYPRTYIKAHYLYEQTILPEVDTQAKAISGTLEVKTRKGTLLAQKIQGAENKATLTLLGFPYDEDYLWDGQIQSSDNAILTVSQEDAFWISTLKQRSSSTIPYFVKVLDGENAGLILDVEADWTATKDRTITLAENINLPDSTQIAIGQWRSLFSIFGQYNTIGLKPGTRAKKSDQVILLDSVNQQVQSYFFNNELMAWVSVEEPETAIADFPIPPWQALFVVRREKAPLYMGIQGTFSNAPAYLPVDSGVNLVANVEGRVLKEDESDQENTYTVLRADELPIYSFNTSEKKLQKHKKTKWWKLLGISKDTPVYMNTQSAFIFTEDEQTVPYILQR